MTNEPLRDLLNRARWRDAALHGLEITLVHRGAPGEQRSVSGARVLEIRSGGVELAPAPGEVEGTFVPYHRFVAIHGVDGALVWETARRARSLARTARPAALRDAGSGARDHELVADAPDPAVVLRAADRGQPLVLDGAAGEGGGQILRSALTLSIVTGTPFVIERIRAGRNKPGLMRQHLTSVRAAAAISGADVEGAVLGSTRLAFRPGPVEGGDFTLDVGSAGASSLVLQTIALPLALGRGPSHVRVRGGTHVPFAPAYPFLAEAWLPLVRQAGAEIELELAHTGFYPAGGGDVVMRTTPCAGLSALHLPGERGPLVAHAHAIVAGLPERIARRELSAIATALPELAPSVSSASVESPGPGNAAWVIVRDTDSGVTNVFSAIGEREVSAEEVGRRVAASALAWGETGAAVEAHLTDQLMLPIALAGAGSFSASALTLHARTNAEVIRAFTGRRTSWTRSERCYHVRLD